MYRKEELLRDGDTSSDTEIGEIEYEGNAKERIHSSN
jgi:hypothetical protein